MFMEWVLIVLFYGDGGDELSFIVDTYDSPLACNAALNAYESGAVCQEYLYEKTPI